MANKKVMDAVEKWLDNNLSFNNNKVELKEEVKEVDTKLADETSTGDTETKELTEDQIKSIDELAKSLGIEPSVISDAIKSATETELEESTETSTGETETNLASEEPASTGSTETELEEDKTAVVSAIINQDELAKHINVQDNGSYNIYVTMNGGIVTDASISSYTDQYVELSSEEGKAKINEKVEERLVELKADLTAQFETKLSEFVAESGENNIVQAPATTEKVNLSKKELLKNRILNNN